MSRTDFVMVTSGLPWASVDDIVERLDALDFWSDDFIVSSLDERKKAWVRREIKTLKDDDDWPLYASIVRQDEETGAETRLYKQEALFDRGDYEAVVAYHHNREDYHRHMAIGYARRAEARFGVQLYFVAD
ncbi:MAG TPA: hypothetical protein VH475_24020 [Tepidisphaeraceae bacterium]|jgi:hypothetical protein